jgi:spermidine/putrescine transport system substrate-binding protein
MKFINFVLDTRNHAWAAQNILYNVPNKPAMESLDPSLAKTYPTMGVTPAELAKHELLRDLGASMKDYSKAVSEIKAAN